MSKSLSFKFSICKTKLTSCFCSDRLMDFTITKKRREAPSFTAGMDRCWARGARCPSDQSNPGASRALNGRGEHGGGGPVLQGGEDVHPSRNAGPCHDTCHSILPKALGSSRPDSLLG